MKTIYKYLIDNPNKITISIYKNAEFLSAQIQNEQIVAWFLVDTTQEKEERIFKWFATGEALPYGIGINLKYLVTIQKDFLVFHLFEYI